MLESAALVGFVGVSDLVRARHFYGDQLGLSLRDETPFALVAEAGGTMLRITAVDDVAPVPYTVLGWSVFDMPAGGPDQTKMIRVRLFWSDSGAGPPACDAAV